MTNKIKVVFRFDKEEEVHAMTVEKDCTIDKFLDLVRDKYDNDDLNCVYLNRRLLENSRKIVDCSKDLAKDIFVVSDDKYKTFTTIRLITIMYCFKDEKKIHEIKIDKNLLISDLIDAIRGELGNDDINCVFLNGRLINNDEMITNIVKDYDVDVFVVSDDESEVPPPPPNAKITKGPFKKVPEEEEDEEEEDKKEDKKEEEAEGFLVFTTATVDSLYEGNKIDIDLNDDYTKVANKIKKHIDDLGVTDLPKDYEIHIFLPGGVPFLPGENPKETKLEPYFNIKDTMMHHLYVVVTKKLEDFIDHKVDEPCNCTKKYKNMLSPLYESTTAGLTQIASLLGYFYHGGVNGEHLLLVLARITKFPPLIVNIFRLLENEELIVRNIVAITGTLFTVFRYFLQTIEKKKVFEYTINIISFIGLVDDVKYINLQVFNLDDDDKDDDSLENTDFKKYFKKTNQQNHIVIWRMDIDSKSFIRLIIDKPSEKLLKSDEIFEAVKTYIPVAPLSLRYIHYPTFVKNENDKEIFLFINEDLNKEDTINYIDPKVGKIEQMKISDLAEKINDDSEENYLSLIDDNCVDQIIVICFDESKSMKFINDEKKVSRLKMATELLKSMVNQTTKLGVSSIYGLISFSSKVDVKQQLTAMSSKFIDGLDKIEPNGSTMLYDALQKAQDMITNLVQFSSKTKDKIGDDEEYYIPYSNAKFRIIVISDGSDNGSKTSPVELANSLVQNNIIVDTVMVSKVEKNYEMCALSHLTGGLCFCPVSINDGIKIFEQEAFLNINMRKVDRPYDKVTKKEFEEFVKKEPKYVKEAVNIEIKKFNVKISLATPLYMNYLYKSQRKIQSIRIHRALKELNIIGYNPSENYVVYSSYNTPSEWRIFIKGPKKTPFENKWFSVFMNLSSKYPAIPPSFRFLTIPFHPNISQEGKLVFSLIDKGYSPKLGIDSIIDGIVKLIAEPELKFAINSEALQLYNDDKKAYKEKQSSLHLRSDYKKYLDNVKVYDEIPNGEDIPMTQRDDPLVITVTNINPRRIISGGSDLI